MFLEVLRFELRFQLRQPLFAVTFGVFFVLAFLGTASERLTIGGGTGNLDLNAAFAVMQTLNVFVVLAMFLVVAFVAGPVVRDVDRQTAELFLATGVSRSAYLWGRFGGAFIVAWLAFVGAIVGVLAGLQMPWLDVERFGPWSWAPFVYGALAIGLPSVFIQAALFYCVATLTRSMIAAYVAAVAMMGAFVVLSIISDPEIIALTSMLDPFGTLAFLESTRYWTVFDKNAQLVGLGTSYFANRALWLGVALAALVIVHMRFRFSIDPPARLWRRRERRAAQAEAPPVVAAAPSRPEFGARTGLAQWYSQTRLEVLGVLRSPAFIAMLLVGVANVLGFYFGAISQFFGTTVYPVTPVMSQGIASSFAILVWVVIAWYAAELVHRERTAGIHEIIDATPHANFVPMFAKWTALAVVVMAMLLVAIATGMLMQLANGYTRLDPGYYAVAVLYAQGAPLLLLAGIGIALQVLVRNRYLGMLVLMVVLVGMLALPGLGYEHRLLRLPFGGLPPSDMDRFGHFLTPRTWYLVYWTAICALLLLVAHLFSIRGMDSNWRARLSWPLAAGAAAAVLVVAGSGGWIFYNTNVLNEFVSTQTREQRQADYERNFGQYRDLPMPEVTDVYMEVDLFPLQRRLASRGHYWLENTSDEPQTALHVTTPPQPDSVVIQLAGATLQAEDAVLGYRQYVFDEPLAPGARVQLEFTSHWDNPGFQNDGTLRLVRNGSFVDNTDFAPLPGYQPGVELTDNNIRRRLDLPPAERAPDLDATEHYNRNVFGTSRRATFEAIVSTTSGQIGIAPGYLTRDWAADGRHYFHYEMDEPIWPFVAFMSADYMVRRAYWRDVTIEVFHHGPHDYNVDRMIYATGKSLDYFTAEFSPYRYRQFRIFEFPAYRTFAQSFPNTIPFSESIGFTADLRDDQEIDYVYYVTAHELAHQWWGHQLVGARVQGASALLETLSQYSALMVMEREYGREHMRRFLRYELDRYLSDRGAELLDEQPLLRVENQPYIHYRKGSLVMYALREYLGEAAVNRALRHLLDNHGMGGPPFPTTRDLVAALRVEADPDQQALITDLWEKIVLFDLKVSDAEVSPTADGRWRVAMHIEAAKLEADGSGREHEVALSMPIQIGVFDGPADDSEEPEPLYLARHLVASGSNRLEVVVDRKPQEVGVDPFNILIDRNPDDNRLRP